MGWKTSGTVTDVDDIATEVPEPKGLKAVNQYSAALAAAADIVTAPGLAADGSWTVELKGSGQAYPTARLSVAVSADSATTVPVSWTAHKGGSMHSSEVDDMTFDDPTNDNVALVQLAAAKTAAIEIVASGDVGDVRGYNVHLAGDATETGWEITVTVARPMESGYPSGS
jgi:hypothetical protein